MITVPAGTRILLATRPVDFRKGAHGLAALAQEVLIEDPFSGTVIVYRSKRSDRVKILVWDTSGLVLVWKQLQQGSFRWPPIMDGVVKLSPVEFAALFDGIDWTRIQVTAQLPRPCYTNRNRPIRLNGLLIKVSSKLHPCFLAVERTDRIVAKSSAPCSDRKPPETFCWTFIILPSCSAKLLVNGTVGSVRKRSTSCLRVRRRSSKLWPTRRGCRPRLPGLPSGGCASWNAMPAAMIAS